MERYAVMFRFDGGEIRRTDVVVDGYNSDNPRKTTFADIPYVIAVKRTGSRNGVGRMEILSVIKLG